jgi:hypothetical protein
MPPESGRPTNAKTFNCRVYLGLEVIMAQHGTKGQGQSHQGKLVVARHNSKMSKRAANALEKAH